MTIPGETPAKKNSRINLRNGVSIPSKKYREWHDMASMVVNKAKGDVKFESRVKVMVEFHHGDLRRRDSDNGLSSILDLLVDCHVLHDDCWKIVRMLEVTNEYDQKNPHCVVTVEEL